MTHGCGVQDGEAAAGTAAQAWQATVETHQAYVAEPIRRMDPNPGPIFAALESELLLVDRSADVDLVGNWNNTLYTGTQVVVTFVPISWLAKGRGLVRLGRGGARGLKTVAGAADNVDDVARLAKGGLPAKAPGTETTALVPKGMVPLGDWGEARLRQVLGNAGHEPTKYFDTRLGKRKHDRIVAGYAHEAKGGVNVGLTRKVEEQILKDYELIRAGEIEGARWHFFQGAQQETLDFLTQHGIRYTVY